MSEIRQSVVDIHTLVTHRRLPVAMASAFGKKIDGIVKEALAAISDSDAGRALRPLLQAIRDGAAQIASQSSSVEKIDGLGKISEALDQYGRDFDDATWRGLQKIE